ncbi:MAG: hypothetical protein IJN61_03760 [Clostridia bacterium]|nr:hypothetical protein [Clostridia bacterium]
MKVTVKQLMWIFIPLLTLASVAIVFVERAQLPDGYGLLWLLPLVYGIFTCSFYTRIVNTDYPITMLLYFGTQFIRMIIMPAAIALAGEASASAFSFVTPDHLHLAIIMILLEFVIVGLFAVVRGSQKIKNKRERLPVLAGAKEVYIVLGIFAVAVYVYFKMRGIDLVYFFTIPLGAEERIGDLTDTFLVLARRIVTVAISFLFLCVVDHYRQKETLRSNKRNLNMPLLAAVLSVCIIVGERRSAQLYTAVAVCYVLIIAFENQKGKILRWVCGAAFVVFALMSVYKQFAGFLYDSYGEAIQNSSMSIGEFANTLQSYFAGPKNIALAMGFAENVALEPSQVLFDFARSTFPVSLFIKGGGQLTSVLLNNYIYFGEQNAGHVLSGTGYGYVFGGMLLFFLPTLLNTAFAFFSEKCVHRVKSFEGIRIWLYVLLRFGINLTANTPALISASSIHLVTSGLVLWAAVLVKRSIMKGKAGEAS